jgi:hypothetical protein
MTRSTDWTQLLMAPATSSVDAGARHRVGRHLAAAIGELVHGLPPGDQVVVTLPIVRKAHLRPDLLAVPDEPFAWKPIFVRRSLGLAVVAACADGRMRSPAEAVGPVAAEAVAEWERTGWRTFHWEPWFAGLTPGGKAMVLADAASWATSLWCSFEWASLGPVAQVGGLDDQWICPAPRPVRLKARPEMQVPLITARQGNQGSDPGRPAVALVSLSGGIPGDGWEEELSFLALVAALRSSARPVPSRVMGLWPDAGRCHTVEIDEGALKRAADRVISTVSALVDVRVPGPREPVTSVETA